MCCNVQCVACVLMFWLKQNETLAKHIGVRLHLSMFKQVYCRKVTETDEDLANRKENKGHVSKSKVA